MEFRLLGKDEKDSYKSAILKILHESDREFVPPLSQRSSTTQKELGNGNTEGKGNSVQLYAEEMLTQKVLICTEDEKLLGLISFKENYTNEYIPDQDLPNLYISTLLVDASARGRGLTRKMYSYLFCELYPQINIFTRTWSTNLAHIKILESFGFHELCRIENHRGESIDTVYYSNLY